MGEINSNKVLVGKTERQLGRPRSRWEDIKILFREIGWEVEDWIQLAQDRVHWRVLLDKVMNFRVR
jgi:hypothetical protein